jgi:hypothetical protein
LIFFSPFSAISVTFNTDMHANSTSVLLPFLMAAVVALNFNVTALSASAGSSTIECWQTDIPFALSTQPGTAGSGTVFLSDAANVSYTIIPSAFDGGLHNAPFHQ